MLILFQLIFLRFGNFKKKFMWPVDPNTHSMAIGGAYQGKRIEALDYTSLSRISVFIVDNKNQTQNINPYPSLSKNSNSRERELTSVFPWKP